MNRNTARAIEKYRLACVPLEEGSWIVGQMPGACIMQDIGVVDGRVESNSYGRQSIGSTLDSAVEDWCNARNLQYERN